MQILGIVMLALVLVGLGAPAPAPVGAVPLRPGPEPVLAPGPSESSTSTGRPYGLTVPPGYEASQPAALVVLLHGYGSRGAMQDAYFGLSRLAREKGFLVAFPDGTKDRNGNRFWNATDACCDFYGRGVDDVAYLDAMLDEITARYRVDPRRIYLVGHSNGAFMSHRFACDRGPRVAAIVTLAGTQWQDPARCPAGSPVSVLHVHGDQDGIIRYEGGSTPKGAYPGAVTTAGTWAAKNACSGALVGAADRLDLDALVPGADTSVERYSGCPGVAVELWTIEGGSHVPAFNPNWAASLWSFLAAHPKPAA